MGGIYGPVGEEKPLHPFVLLELENAEIFRLVYEYRELQRKAAINCRSLERLKKEDDE